RVTSTNLRNLRQRPDSQSGRGVKPWTRVREIFCEWARGPVGQDFLSPCFWLIKRDLPLGPLSAKLELTKSKHLRHGGFSRATRRGWASAEGRLVQCRHG